MFGKIQFTPFKSCPQTYILNFFFPLKESECNVDAVLKSCAQTKII